MKILKKIGRILLCPLPMLVMLGLQVVCVFIYMIDQLIWNLQGGEDVYQLIMNQYGTLLVQVQLVTLAVFFLWYFLAQGHKKPFALPHKVLTLSDLGLFLLLGIGFYGLITIYMGAASLLTPELMEEYEELVESSNMGDLSFWSTISTLIMAPLSEELIFRGITMGLAKKAFRHFWIANLVQALLFGIAHLNWIQGTYAFLLGLALGYVCQLYQSLYAGMLLHLLFNFCGTYLAALISLLPIPDAFLYLILLLVGVPFTAFALYRMYQVKKEPAQGPAPWTGEP